MSALDSTKTVTVEDVLQSGEDMVQVPISAHREQLSITRALIEIVEAPFCHSLAQRKRAARLLERFAAIDRDAFGLVRSSADKYIHEQKTIDDEYPYSPNSQELVEAIEGRKATLQPVVM